MTVLPLQPFQFIHRFTWSSLMANEFEVVDADSPLMLCGRSLYLGTSTGKFQTHLYEHDEYSQRGGISYMQVKEPSRATLSLRRAYKGKGTKGTRHFPGQYRTLGSSYFPFAIPTQYFQVKALPNKIMLDAELPITSAVGSRSHSLDKEPAAWHGCTCLTVSHHGGSFLQCSAIM